MYQEINTTWVDGLVKSFEEDEKNYFEGTPGRAESTKKTYRRRSLQTSYPGELEHYARLNASRVMTGFRKAELASGIDRASL